MILDRGAHKLRDASPLQGGLNQVVSVIRIEGPSGTICAPSANVNGKGRPGRRSALMAPSTGVR